MVDYGDQARDRFRPCLRSGSLKVQDCRHCRAVSLCSASFRVLRKMPSELIFLRTRMRSRRKCKGKRCLAKPSELATTAGADFPMRPRELGRKRITRVPQTLFDG